VPLTKMQNTSLCHTANTSYANWLKLAAHGHDNVQVMVLFTLATSCRTCVRSSATCCWTCWV